MRIIAGLAKGKTLLSPVDARVRPTSDRAREGLFSSLESEFSSIQDLKFLDLFAGSGAVGVEAFSRGAAIVHGVEAESDVNELAVSNFQLVKNSSGKYRVFKSKALAFLESDSAMTYDIIFMDPPYDVNNSAIEELLEVIDQRKLIQPRGIIAIERETKSSPFTWPAAMELLKIRSYGQGSIFYGAYSASV
jgi:16S rRNA (guanine966-N2)-methyltransferase